MSKHFFKIDKGNLIIKALDGEFDVIAHGCNCFCTQKSGIAVEMVKNFKTDTFPMETRGKGDINKLGQIDFMNFYKGKKDSLFQDEDWYFSFDRKEVPDLVVVNAYTQYKYGKNHDDGEAIPLDYRALALCFKKINHTFKGKHIGLPLIGGGLAGGDMDIIIKIMRQEFKNCDITLVLYDKN